MKNTKIYLLFFLGAILSVSVWIFCLFKLNKMKNENNLIYNEINEAEQKIKEIKNTKTIYEKSKNEIEIINEIILNKDDFVKLIENLEALAEASNVELKLKSFDIPKENKTPIIGFEANGDFKNIFLFLKMIENSSYLSSFSRIVIQKNQENTESQNNKEQITEKEKNYTWMLDANLKILSYKNKN